MGRVPFVFIMVMMGVGMIVSVIMEGMRMRMIMVVLIMLMGMIVPVRWFKMPAGPATPQEPSPQEDDHPSAADLQKS